jgi:hypothetical protein
VVRALGNWRVTKAINSLSHELSTGIVEEHPASLDRDCDWRIGMEVRRGFKAVAKNRPLFSVSCIRFGCNVFCRVYPQDIDSVR